MNLGLEKKRNLIAASILLFCLFFGLRIWGILELSIQADEVHWRDRSLEVIERIKEHQWSKVTTHLGQPGVPPSIIMAASEVVGKKLGLLHFELGDVQLDYLHFARFGCAFFASLIVFPLIFLGGRIAGYQVGLLSCLFLALSPNHLGISKLAHLDAVMSLFVAAAVLFYVISQLEDRFDFKIISGIFWGLAIATKPTAGSLALGFLLFNISMNFILPQIGQLENFSTVSDLWAVFFGHLVFGAIYTRLWIHESDYLVRLKVVSLLADIIYQFGMDWHFLWPGIFILLLVWGVRIGRGVRNSIAFLATCFLLFWFSFPQVLEGMIRFWTWSFGLSGQAHVSYGKQTAGLPMGYFGILFGDLSPITLLGMFGGAILVIYRSVRFRNKDDLGLLGIVVIASVWILLLSTSSKQTIRYLLPVVSILFLLGAYFYKSLFDFVVSKTKIQDTNLCGSICLLFLISPYVLTTLRLSPYQMMYENRIFNSVFRGGNSIGHSYFVGLNEVVRFVQGAASKEKQSVFVFGDMEAIKLTQSIISPYSTGVKFSPPRKNTWGHLLVRFRSLDFAFKDDLSDEIDKIEPLLSTVVEDREIISVYRMPIPDLSLPKKLLLEDFYKGKGVVSNGSFDKAFPGVIPCPTGLDCLGLKAGSTKKGYVAFGLDPFFKEGGYVFEIKIAGYEDLKKLDLAKPVLRLSIGKCENLITGQEVENNNFKSLKFVCKFNEVRPRRIDLYWFGSKSLILSDLSVKAVQDNSIVEGSEKGVLTPQ